MGAVGAIVLAAACGLWRGHEWGRQLAVCFWIAAGLLALVTDRSVSGPGEPWHTYLINLMLIPGAITAALLHGIGSVRMYFRSRRES